MMHKITCANWQTYFPKCDWSTYLCQGHLNSLICPPSLQDALGIVVQDLCSILQIISQFLANLEKYFCVHIESMTNDSTSPLVLGFQHTLMDLLPICSILRNTVKEFKRKILILSTEQGFLKYMSVSQNTHTYAHTWSLSVLIMYKPVPDIFSGFLCSEIIFFLN